MDQTEFDPACRTYVMLKLLLRYLASSLTLRQQRSVSRSAEFVDDPAVADCRGLTAWTGAARHVRPSVEKTPRA